MLKNNQDAYGHELYDYMKGTGEQPIAEIVERDDGLISVHDGLTAYFSEYREWPVHQKKAVKYMRGKVLDIGCGAGRHSLYLQEKGFDVTGLDNSPLAIEVCKSRGLKKTVLSSINQINARMGLFNTVIMMGNNFGLFGSFDKARKLLKKIHRITSKNGRIIAESNDVYQTDDPEHLSYHRWNLERGRMGGQIKIRVRHRKYITPWFDYLMVSKAEMENILLDTDWHVTRYIDSDGPVYIAVIDKNKD